MSDIANSEARHLAILYRQMMKHLDRELAPLGLGPGRYAYLFALYARDDRTQQELADAVCADKAAAARALARLEADGYILRRPDARDRRVTRVTLSARAQPLRSVLENAAASSIDALTRELDRAERRQIKSLLAKMVQPYLRV